MQDTVRHQMRTLDENLRRGDVILANHPKAGGSHLPDLTVITPVFYADIDRPVFFVANRGHHADIGGISPGSMPPHSNFLWQEGARFRSFKIVDGGIFQEEKLVAALMEPGKYEGSSGTRCLQVKKIAIPLPVPTYQLICCACSNLNLLPCFPLHYLWQSCVPF